MRRKGLLAGIMLAAVLSFTACSNSNKSTDDAGSSITQDSQNVKIDVADVMTKVLSKDESAMMEGNAELLEEYYGLTSESVASFAYQIPKMNVNSTEYLIVEAVSQDKIQTIIDGINSRLSFLEGQWSMYLQDQYELVQNSKLYVQGNYVFFLISENPEYAENVFMRAFDESIPEVTVKTKYQQITGILNKYSDTEIVVTFTDEDGNEVTVNGTPFESIYIEGEFELGDEVNIALEERTPISDDHTIDGVITYVGPIVIDEE